MPEASLHGHVYASASSAEPVSPITQVGSEPLEANMAMISDGSRYMGSNRTDLSSQLPPYSPGNLARMNGHGNENNDTRLSDYVKGETRAQDMKDTGNF